ncbi:hypothetical protein ABHI18_007950 [Aspergillus niger]
MVPLGNSKNTLPNTTFAHYAIAILVMRTIYECLFSTSKVTRPEPWNATAVTGLSDHFPEC